MPLEEASLIGETPEIGAINVQGAATLGVISIDLWAATKVFGVLAKKTGLS